MGPAERHGPERRAVQRSARNFRLSSCGARDPGLRAEQPARPASTGALGAVRASGRVCCSIHSRNTPRSKKRAQKDRPLRTAPLRPPPRTAPLGLAQRTTPEDPARALGRRPGQCAGSEPMDRDATKWSRPVQSLDAPMTDPVV